MKYFYILIFVFNSILSFGQSLKYGTISYSGGNYTYDTYKGGFTVGEVGVKDYISTDKYLEGFEYIESNPYPGCLTVKTSNSSGKGSFREAVQCALDGDEIIFDPSLADQYLFFDLPAINIDKPLSIKNTNGIIKFRNQNPNNTQPLLLFSNNITIEQGIELNGTNGGMIIHVIAPYTLTWK